ncbi:MAG TPA: alkaline phosphatase family protein [Myxococcales bacterium]|nr:alkaline phosphatase family protein [Myxococcales bacterium]
MIVPSRGRLVEGLVRHLLRPVAQRGHKSRAPLPSGRRLLLLHLDGVGREQLEEAMESGHAPTLRRLLEKGPYRLSRCRAGAPTSTPAFQAGLLYGTSHDIPGYTWYDKRRRREVRMDRAADARLVEAELHACGAPLLEGGAVYCSIFSGGALPRRWTLSGIDEELQAADFGIEKGAQWHDLLAAAMVHAATAGRIAGTLGADVAGALWEMGGWARRVGSLQHEPQFLLNRVMTECLFAEFAANACVVEIARGTPIVYACFIGYDEYAHRRGPRSRVAARKLWELDRMLGRILSAVNALPELGYELYLFSDHGQSETRPAEDVLGESLAESLLGTGVPDGGDAANVAALARWWRSLSHVLPQPLGAATLAWARHLSAALDAAQPGRADGPLLVVPCGDVAQLYSTAVAEPLREGEVRMRHPGLLEACARSPAVGFTLVRTDRGPVALRGDRRIELHRAAGALEFAHGVGHPLAAVYARDMLSLRSAGDVVLLGAGAPCGATVAYPFEFGSHGGLSPQALDTFMIHPEALGDQAFAGVVRPQDLHRFFIARSGRAARDPAAMPCAS